MLKITIEAADEVTFYKMLCNLVSLEDFDTKALLAETRCRFKKEGHAVLVIPDELKESEAELNEAIRLEAAASRASEREAITAAPPLPKRRRGRPPRDSALAEDGRRAEAAATMPAGPSPPSRAEVIAALEKYAEQNNDEADGMLKARKIIAEVSGVKNAALKDVDPRDYQKLMDALV